MLRMLFFAYALIFLMSCGLQVAREDVPEPIKAAITENLLEKYHGQVQFDLADITRRGKLIALCRYNTSGYFIYHGEPMGYEYELLRLLAEELGVELEIRVPRSWERMFEMLQSGEGDIIAVNTAVTLGHSNKTRFTAHHSTSRQMLVQRRPEGWRDMKKHQIENGLIRNPLDLAGKKIHVRRTSAYYQRLRNLSEEIGSSFEIIESPEELETEVLIKMVADGVIDYTVTDENLRDGYEAYYSNLDIRTPLSFPQKIAWLVRDNSPLFLTAVNTWIGKMKSQKDPVYYVIYNKYFRNRTAFIKRLSSEYLSFNSEVISPYDSLFRKYGGEIGWDWKILASMAFQESRFNPEAESLAGARGLMQLLPGTSEEMGIEDPLNPEESIRGSVRFLKVLFDTWKTIPSYPERIKFTLASYNTGLGHVLDARRLAMKYGKNPNVWSGNVAEFLLKKSEKEYYVDEVVKYGYCKGEEPYNYVRHVMERYRVYKKYEEYMTDMRTSGLSSQGEGTWIN